LNILSHYSWLWNAWKFKILYKLNLRGNIFKLMLLVKLTNITRSKYLNCVSGERNDLRDWILFEVEAFVFKSRLCFTMHNYEKIKLFDNCAKKKRKKKTGFDLFSFLRHHFNYLTAWRIVISNITCSHMTMGVILVLQHSCQCSLISFFWPNVILVTEVKYLSFWLFCCVVNNCFLPCVAMIVVRVVTCYPECSILANNKLFYGVFWFTKGCAYPFPFRDKASNEL